MNRFNVLRNLFAVLTIVATLFMFNACTEDCLTDCGANGTCTTDANGNEFCLCDAGYFGPNCEDFDFCLNVECPPNSTCDETDGYCLCDPGYEGDSCHLEIRAKYFGNYNGEDFCSTGTFNNNMTIVAHADSVDYFVIQGFGGFVSPASTVNVKILDSDNFTIPLQTDEGSRVIRSGDSLGDFSTGTRNETTGVAVITYFITYSDGTSETCELTLTPM